jgi:hypothetical protein
MTATEVQVRYELMQRLLGPTLGRFQSEFLNPLIERVFGIMSRAEVFLPPPPILGNATIDIEYVGPLARSQRMEEATAVERLYQLTMQLAQADPGVMDIINSDTAIRMRAELLGVPKSVLRSENEVKKIRQDRQKAMMQQQQLEAQKQQSEIAANQGQAMSALSTPEVKEGTEEMMTQLEEEGLMEE